MATVTACTSASSLTRTALLPKGCSTRTTPSVLGLPAMKGNGKVRCSMDKKTEKQENKDSKMGLGGSSMLAAACAAAMSSPVSMALVDERMSTEGTGLPFGLSNNVLGWILFGVFGLIWALYFTYVLSLEEDEESGGLSL